ncbi:MAG: hypothetical protein Fur005_40290 [Roseiflexaceae bacterium]
MLQTVAKLTSLRFGSFTEAMDTYLTTAAQLTGVRSAFISRLDNQVMEVLGSWDNQGCGIPLGGVVPLEETFCQYVRSGNEVVVVEDALHDPRVTNVATRTTFNIGSYLGVPLHYDDGSVMGSFCLLDPEPRLFREEQAHALTILANQIARLVQQEIALRAVIQLERDATADLQAALQAVDERGLLLQTVAHDLRTPLTSIRGYTDMLIHEVVGQLNPEQSRILSRISGSARFMHRLVNDLIDLSQIDRGGLLLNSESYDPAELLQQVSDLTSGQAQNQRLQIRVDLEPDLPSLVGDSIRLQQILLNLVSNAIRYTSEGMIVLRAKLSDGVIEYSVCDNGPGIPDHAQEVIWQLGWRGGSNQQSRNTGLGLYLVRRFSEAMGGTATVANNPDRGCTFTVRLPLVLEHPVRATLV